MKIVIDTDICKSAGYSLAEVLYLASLYYDNQINDAIVEKLHRLGLVNVNEIQDDSSLFPYKNCYISIDGGKLMQEIIFNSNKVTMKGKTPKDNICKEYLEIARAMQEAFPEGKKPGTSLKWKCSDLEVADKLMKLMNKTDKKYTKEEFVQAAKSYVQSYNGNYAYMQVLMYFVSKRVNIGGQFEERSQLLSYLQNAGQENMNKDWTSELR